MSVARKIDKQEQIIDDGDMSGNLISSVINLAARRHLAIQAVWTGTPVGDLQLEVSNDNSNWSDQGTPTAAGGAAGSAMFTEQFAPWTYARLTYTSTSSTGVLNANSITKE